MVDSVPSSPHDLAWRAIVTQDELPAARNMAALFIDSCEANYRADLWPPDKRDTEAKGESE